MLAAAAAASIRVLAVDTLRVSLRVLRVSVCGHVCMYVRVDASQYMRYDRDKSEIARQV